MFDDHGHGALVYEPTSIKLGDGEFDVAVTGPRRNIFRAGTADEHGTLRAYFPAPFGDMMITGCFGLLAATADVMPELGEEIRTSLGGIGVAGVAPWDVD